MKLSRLVGISALVVVLFGGCVAAVPSTPGATTPAGTAANGALPADLPQEFQIVWQAWNELKRDSVYRDQLDPRTLSEGAVRGMIQAMDDPHAAFMDSEGLQQEREAISGTFDGIGAEVATRDGRTIIVAPIQDTPAERAGIKPGDTILSVNGESVEDKTLLEVVQLIRGPRGTVVKIGILHVGASRPEEIEITREQIRVRTVKYSFADGVSTIRLTSFSENTDGEIAAALSRMRQDKAKGLILDLRSNPGGLLDTVVNVASRFLKDGLVLYEVDSHGERTDWNVRRVDRAPDVPMVVLVNEYSASASEVLSGALRDHGRATLVGETTFGKGSVNVLRELSGGSGIYFSVARWYTPKGDLIEGKGLKPEIEVPQSEVSPPPEDGQFNRGLEVLRAKMDS